LEILQQKQAMLIVYSLVTTTTTMLQTRHIELKIGTSVTLAVGNIHTNFGFPHLCIFELEALPTGQIKRRRDGQTDGWLKSVSQH